MAEVHAETVDKEQGLASNGLLVLFLHRCRFPQPLLLERLCHRVEPVPVEHVDNGCNSLAALPVRRLLKRTDHGIVGLPCGIGVALCLLEYGPAEHHVVCDDREVCEVFESPCEGALPHPGPDPLPPRGVYPFQIRDLPACILRGGLGKGHEDQVEFLLA